MSTNRIVRRQLDRELSNLEDLYLAFRDLKSGGALEGQPLSVIVPFDDAVESLAAAMQRLRNAISLLNDASDSPDKQG